jgi:enoyl-CoA hydratase/carnithine racemase
MQAELHQALAELDASDQVRVIVVTGRGRFFSTGADLEAGGSTFAQSAEETARLRETMAVRPRPWNLTTPVIGALNGAAVGLGLTLTLQWDIRIFAEDAKYGFVFPRRGLTPEAGSTWFLPRLVGLGRATELLLTGRFFVGQEAAAIGLGVRSLPAGEVLDAALEMATDVATNCSPTSLAMIKEMLRELTPLDDVEDAWSKDWEIFRWIGREPDAAEGVRSFLEKDTPSWKGSKRAQHPALPDRPWGDPT